MRVAIATFGCKVNQYDSEIMRENLEEKGFALVPFSEAADIYMINTCTVTGKTDFQARQMVRRAHRNNPDAKIVVTGCYAQAAPEDLKKIPGVSLVIGNHEKWEIGTLLSESEKIPSSGIMVTPIGEELFFPEKKIKKFSAKTRFFLKIQDGCNACCSYCIVPHVRGKSRSMTPKTVLDFLSTIGSSGYKEAVLTGIHLGAYGLDLSPQTSLLNLLQKIEKQMSVPRVRLSSIEPNEINQELIDFLADSTIFCPHLHLPLQSGDNTILRKMNRPYSALNFHSLVLRLKNAIKDLAIGADVIVGFPGEGNEEFSQTLRLLEELPITYLHVFPFSPRKGTTAFSFPNKVKGDAVKTRSEILRRLSKKKRESFYRSYLNKKLPILIEARRHRKTGLLKGLSRNYLSVLIEGSDNLMNQEITVRITSVEGEEIKGEIAQ
ncbi:MAG: tRNA (N(6)-L-threonylcarbamoyladenosine(37)-C(2))-methylthiotransferase MtaB [Thermodesulfobacteriota bacterium]|jgi:threonylcarbamoyladenosine tRNA methylthiotransferase MtaB|nr:MAG: tRNA (N(6)-L-threonylcarbamoyladenosine(37)-C(2))-methylthiotransferase MtaB [Thermodesulfobacteriota bacterium]